MKRIDAPHPYIHFGGTGEILHFAHANAYPPQCYRSLLLPLTTGFQVESLLFRPLLPGSSIKSLTDWEVLADDLIRFCDQQGHRGIIGAGHSLGAICTLIAAVKRPDLFSKLILIEPVLLSKAIFRGLRFMPPYLRQFAVPPARIARKRRDHWPDREAAFRFFRAKRVFGKISDETLRDYIQFGIRPAATGGVELAFSREWEAHIYTRVSSPWPWLKQLQIPALGIRGNTTDTIAASSWSDWQRIKPDAHFLQIANSGHLLPFEQPEVLIQNILSFLQTRAAADPA